MVSKKVLIVGAGMVGTWTARSVASNGHEVQVIDLVPASGYFTRFSGLPAHKLTALPENWVVALQNIVQSTDWQAVVNTTSVERKVTDELTVIDVLTGALQGSSTRLIHISSLAVYGVPSQKLVEDAELSPRSEYGICKLKEENLIRQSPELDYCILRSCGLVGPIRHGKGSHSARFLDQVLRRSIAHGAVEILGGRNWGDEYLYVGDLTDAVATAIDTDLGNQRIMNIGSGVISTIDDVANAVKEAVPGTEVKTIYQEFKKTPLGAMNVEQANNILGFQQKYTLSNALSECVNFIRGTK